MAPPRRATKFFRALTTLTALTINDLAGIHPDHPDHLILATLTTLAPVHPDRRRPSRLGQPTPGHGALIGKPCARLIKRAELITGRAVLFHN